MHLNLHAQRQRQIEAEIAAIETHIETLIARDEHLAERFAILQSIPGISKITAFVLLIEMPEPGTMNGKQAASLEQPASTWTRSSCSNPIE